MGTDIKIKKHTSSTVINICMIIALFVLCQILISTGVMTRHFKGMLIPIIVNVILAMSLNLVVGVLGELSLGHAGFVCVGAYIGSLFSLLTKDVLTVSLIRFPLAIIVGGLAAALFGLLIGFPVFRLKGDYLAIVTLAFGEIIKNIFNNIYLVKGADGLQFTMSVDKFNQMSYETELIKGASGIKGTPQDSNIIIGFILILICLVVISNIVNSRTGRAIMAIRDNRIAAESIGINITKYKFIAFIVSAFFAGTAGVLYSHNLTTLTAPKFDYNMSILVLVYVVLGGMGSMRGSIIAAIVLTALPELFRQLNDYRMLMYAIVLIVMMLLKNNEKVQTFIAKISVKKNRGKKVDSNANA